MVKLLCDMDGVICNFYGGFIDFLNKTYNLSIDPSIEPLNYEIDRWNIDHSVDINKACRKWISSGGFSKLEAFDGAKEFIKELVKICNVSLVTARIGDWDFNTTEAMKNQIKTDTLDWLKRLGAPVDNVFFCSDKVGFCKDNGIGLMIEDKLETALKAAKEGIQVILIDRRYNHSKVNRLNIYRAFSYSDVLDKISDLKAK